MPYDCEAHFVAANVHGRLISVSITFDIERDDDEVTICGQTVFKKCYSIINEREEYTYHGGQENGKAYKPTPEDLDEWKHQRRKEMMRVFNRQTA